jgi:octanoyl-[GcvH]:protein N-octanoyltransferase
VSAVLLLRDAHPADPALDIALSHALLRRVAAGEHEPATRLYRPGPTLALGRLDELEARADAAGAAGNAHGLTPVLRLVGGRAAVYDEACLIYEEIVAAPDPVAGLTHRFEDATALLADVLRGLGADARPGQIPGEYCPGEYSVSVAGRVKVVGTGQRLVRGAALLSTVIVVGHGERIRAALQDVYAALGLAFDPSTAGALDDTLPGLTVDAVLDALLAALGRRDDPLKPGTADAATLAAADELRSRHARSSPR